MLKIKQTPTFKKDFKRLLKKHYRMEELKTAVKVLAEQDTKTLVQRYNDHALTGNWQGYRDLHIQKDWLLIYLIDEEEGAAILVRTGKHDEVL